MLSEHLSKAIKTRQLVWILSHHSTFFLAHIQELKKEIIALFVISTSTKETVRAGLGAAGQGLVLSPAECQQHCTVPPCHTQGL